MADHPIPDITAPANAVAALQQDDVPVRSVDIVEEKVQKITTRSEEKKEKVAKENPRVVPFRKLFAFADRWDYLLMIIGSIGAIGNGVSMPLMTLIFGDLTNAFGNNQTNTSVVVDAVSKVCTSLSVLTFYITWLS